MTKTDLKTVIEQVVVEQLEQVYQALKIQMRKIIKEEIQRGMVLNQGNKSNVKSMLNMPSHQKLSAPSYANVNSNVGMIPQQSQYQPVINTGNAGKFSIHDILSETQNEIIRDGVDLSELGVGRD